MGGMGLRRGEVYSAVLAREFGRPRPVVIIQSEIVRTSRTIILCPLTSDLVEDAAPFRVRISPNATNALRELSDVMCDKVTAADATRVGAKIGELTNEQMGAIAERLTVILGLAD